MAKGKKTRTPAQKAAQKERTLKNKLRKKEKLINDQKKFREDPKTAQRAQIRLQKKEFKRNQFLLRKKNKRSIIKKVINQIVG